MVLVVCHTFLSSPSRMQTDYHFKAQSIALFKEIADRQKQMQTISKSLKTHRKTDGFRWFARAARADHHEFIEIP